MSYDHKAIDGKWQKRWEEAGIFHAQNDSSKQKCYILVEFPYPSGAGLHVGHPRSYTALDVVARKRRMDGQNVLFPMGWDAFGLPAENYAIKTGVHPAIVTKQNTDTFRRQLQAIGFSFDWSREVNTTDPAYYKWTQWMFLEFFKAGLAYKAKMAINWCPKDKIGLANEEVVGGKCERCGGPVEKREKEQWMIAITKYADRLLEDLSTVNYLPKIKKQQEEWIGRSEGAEIDFAVDGTSSAITVFTTRPDTIFGATYVVLAPEHPLVAEVVTDDRRADVDAYVSSARAKTDIERGDDTKDKTGVFTGAVAINPVNGEKIPVWVADYVLPHYGTGAIMAVPAHDERDFAFATKYELPIRVVVEPVTGEPRENEEYRRSIVAIVRNPKTNEFLSINWGKELGGNLFIGGGRDEGEDPVACAKREIAEETGYVNVRLVAQAETIHHHYFAHSKNKARIIDCVGMYFELENDERVATHLEADEQGKFTVEWLPQGVVEQKIVEKLHALTYSRLVKGECYTGDGIATASGFLDGLSTAEATTSVINWLETQEFGKRKTTYRLRDWVFSRQRYWGEPIPLVHCDACASTGSAPGGWVAVPVEQLPVTLPSVEKYEPTDNGESPLAAIPEFVNTKCPQCGGAAKRETDTMPNWAGSSWYFLRYTDPHNDAEFASKAALEQWMPVDIYNGGMEHTTLHLLYSRFWNKFLFDRGLVPTSEPYARRHSHGLIMADDGTKMSKSKGNVVNPDEIVAEYGADTFRVYQCFMGPFEEPVPWSTNGVVGVRRFLDRVMRMTEMTADVEEGAVTKALHKTIKKVTDDIENFSFNTAVAAMMSFVNTAYEHKAITKDSLGLFAGILCPFAPHVANEIHEAVCSGFIESEAWPVYDAALAADDELTIAVQVNGKLRGTIIAPADASEGDIVAKAKADENVAKHLTGEPKKTVYVKGKLVNFVI